MNAYDFDKTIFHQDSTAQFALWCIKRSPRAALGALRLIVPGVGLLLHKVSKERFKERLFAACFPKGEKLERELQAFWRQNIGGVYRWYLNKKREDDVVISASPEFVVRPAMNLLGIKMLIASPLNPETGRFEGKNCHGEEKVARFRALYPQDEVEEFYSDSLSDAPMARLAKQAWLVQGEKLIPWPQDNL